MDMHYRVYVWRMCVSEAAFSQGHALQVGVQRKLAANLPNCRSSGLDCIPLVAETLGGLAEDFIATIKAIGRSLRLRSGSDRESDPTRHLFGRISLALWRGNALMFIHRSPTIPSTLMAWHERIHSHKNLCYA